MTFDQRGVWHKPMGRQPDDPGLWISDPMEPAQGPDEPDGGMRVVAWAVVAILVGIFAVASVTAYTFLEPVARLEAAP